MVISYLYFKDIKCKVFNCKISVFACIVGKYISLLHKMHPNLYVLFRCQLIRIIYKFLECSEATRATFVSTECSSVGLNNFNVEKHASMIQVFTLMERRSLNEMNIA